MGSRVRINETIEETVKANLCTGCGTCAALCPCSAIEIIKNEYKGVYIPKLDRQKCNQCGICYKVCPGAAINYKELNIDIFGKEPYDNMIGNYLNCYTAYATDCGIRYNSSSGGLVTAILIYALEQGIIDGALVTRMKKDKPLEPEPFIARTKDEIIEASGSKYCPVHANTALKEIIDVDGKYAVVGLPCHINGIRKAEKINMNLHNRIVLHLGILCAKTISFTGTENLLQRKKIYKDDIQELWYRGKGYPGGMTIKFKDDWELFLEKKDYYDVEFSRFTPNRCLLCCDHSSELADISFGDAWLPEIIRTDHIGTSIIISRSIYADEILDQMLKRGQISLNSLDIDDIYVSQGGFSFKKKTLSARLVIWNLFGHSVPNYNHKYSSQISTKCYLVSLFHYQQCFLASRRSLLKLLDLHTNLLRFVSRFSAKFKR